jgi:uncharacterized surface protein with fasciclin (FAS1) repeats
MRIKLFVGAILIGLLVFGLAPAPGAGTDSIYATLASMNETAIIYVSIKEAEEAATVKGDDEYTLFAPTDAAFKKLDEPTIKKLAADKAVVRQLVRGHIVKGKLTTDDLKKLDGVRTLSGDSLKVENAKDGLRVGGAKIVTANIPCNNGMIHVIDAVAKP